jgi:hypothetical protein
MSDKIERLQVTLLCDEHIGMLTLPKAAIESLSAGLVKAASGVIAVCTVDDTRVYYKLSLGPPLKWTKIEVALEDAQWSPFIAPLSDGSALIVNRYRVDGSFISGRYVPSTGEFQRMRIADDFAERFETARAAFQIEDGRVLFVFEEIDSYEEIAIVALTLHLGTWTHLKDGIFVHKECSSIMMADGNLLFVGGARGGDDLKSARCVIYDVKKNDMSNVEYMNLNRSHSGICLMPNGHVFVTGGQTDVGGVCEEYDPDENEWLLLPRLMPATVGARCVLIDGGKILVAGCDEDASWANFYIYDVATNKYTDIEAPVDENVWGVEFIPLY